MAPISPICREGREGREGREKVEKEKGRGEVSTLPTLSKGAKRRTKICVADEVARLVCGETFSAGQERRRALRGEEGVSLARGESEERTGLLGAVNPQHGNKSPSVPRPRRVRSKDDDVPDDGNHAVDDDHRPALVDFMGGEGEEDDPDEGEGIDGDGHDCSGSGRGERVERKRRGEGGKSMGEEGG